MESVNRAWLILLAGTVLGAVFITAQDVLAGALWHRLSLPRAAILLLDRDAALAFEIGEYYFGGGAHNLSAAERAYGKAQRIDPAMLGPRYQLARIAFLRGEFPLALRLIDEELSLHPDFIRSYYVRGLIYGYTHDYRSAARDFERFLAWDPKSWAAHNDLAWVYFSGGKFAEAELTAARGLAFNPGNPWLLVMRGSALLSLDKAEEARGLFLEARKAVAGLSPAEWGAAYPGNDPAVYRRGLGEMRALIERNLETAERAL